MQLRRKLFLVLSLMAMVPLLFLLFGVVARVENDLEFRTAAELSKTLGKMGQEIHTLMATQKALAAGLAKVPVVRAYARAVQSNDPAEIERVGRQLGTFLLNYQATVPGIQAIRFIDLRGKTLVKVREGRLIPARNHGAAGRGYVEDIAYKPFFKRAIGTGRPISISNFERGKVAGEPEFCPAMVRYSVPIRDELDTLFGLLTINMWGRRVDDAVQAALGGYPGKAYIAEMNDDPARDGIYLYHENPKWRFANQLGTHHRLSTELGAHVWHQIKIGATSGELTLAGGRELFYRKYAPYPDRDTKWLLVIETARHVVLAPVASLRRWIAYLIAAALLLSLVVARWAAMRLARPVHDLAQIISCYAHGERAARYIGQGSDEIGAAGKAFNRLADSLDRAHDDRDKAERAARQSERLASLGQLAAGIGHEINNPLMNIMSLARLLEDSVPASDSQGREDLHTLQREGKRCARIVQGILNFARETPPQFRQFDFSVLLDDTAALFSHKLKDSLVTLELNVARPLLIEGDPNQLQQVLVNVILNAIQVAPPKTEIVVNALPKQDTLEVEILDQGSGLPENAESQLFDPFFTSRPEGGGTGLGLSVSYGIIERHGGTISLEDRLQGGVRVLIRIPMSGVHGTQSPALPELNHCG